jgi:hypothetical protein
MVVFGSLVTNPIWKSDILKNIVDLKLTMVKYLGFFYAEHIYETLCPLLQCEGRQAGVLIFPPDRSVALLADNDEVAVFDSHEHGQNGGNNNSLQIQKH